MKSFYREINRPCFFSSLKSFFNYQVVLQITHILIPVHNGLGTFDKAFSQFSDIICYSKFYIQQVYHDNFFFFTHDILLICIDLLLCPAPKNFNFFSYLNY